VIQTCGSLTFKAAGQVRNIGIIIVSMAVFGDRVTVTQAVGYAINVVGFCVYQVVKTREDLHNLREEFKREALDGDEGVRIAAGGEDATAKTPLLDRAGSPLGGDKRGRGVSSGV
jgi:thiamine monophosphate kinase